MISPDERMVELGLLSGFFCLEFGLIDSALEDAHFVLVLLLSLFKRKLQIGHVLSVAVYFRLQRLYTGYVRSIFLLKALIMCVARD